MLTKFLNDSSTKSLKIVISNGKPKACLVSSPLKGDILYLHKNSQSAEITEENIHQTVSLSKSCSDTLLEAIHQTLSAHMSLFAT